MTNPPIQTANFGFLAKYDAQLARLGALAERYFGDDPNTSLMKLRQFAELLAQLTAAKTGQLTKPDESQTDRFCCILVLLVWLGSKPWHGETATSSTGYGRISPSEAGNSPLR